MTKMEMLEVPIYLPLYSAWIVGRKWVFEADVSSYMLGS